MPSIFHNRRHRDKNSGESEPKPDQTAVRPAPVAHAGPASLPSAWASSAQSRPPGSPAHTVPDPGSTFDFERSTEQQPTEIDLELRERKVRVFVSSTFLDMLEDREALMADAWPELRRFCDEKDIEFVEVDLRWGITESQAQQNQTMALCLKEISDCRPYFIGLLGERYGWRPEPGDIPETLLNEEPWITTALGKSATEIEMLHAVLNDPERCKRAFFYIRDREYAESKGSGFLPDNEQDRADLAGLKRRVNSLCDAGAATNHSYPAPEALAALVIADLKAAISEDFAEEQATDQISTEARRHEAYAAVRRQVYIGGERYYEQIDRHLLYRGNPIVITGESGGGKSALIANWLYLQRTASPDNFVFQHYIVSSEGSANYVRLVRRLINEIQVWTKSSEARPTDDSALGASLPMWLSSAKGTAAKAETSVPSVLWML